MKISLFFLIAMFFTSSSLFAQWMPSGVDIYNTNSGNVGVGVTNPTYKLDIAGRTRIRSGGGSAGIWFNNYDNSSVKSFIGMVNDDHVGIYGQGMFNWGLIMNVNTGNMSIGNAAPAGKLHIQSTTSFWGAYNYGKDLLINSSGHPTIGIFDAGGNNPFAISNVSGNLQFALMPALSNSFTAPDTKLTIRNDGNIGIGTSLQYNPNNYKLAVNGIIGAKAVKVEVTSTAWADYVFAKDYKLRSLSEVESYIKANRHLPEVPSAQQVENEGLNLGEMDIILLKKIEELTLYMIELTKENQRLQEQNLKTQKDNQALSKDMKALKDKILGK
jgi:hypothetical protein